MENIRSEKGSITLFVLIVMMFITIFLIGLYVTNSNSSISSTESTKRIKDIYEKDINNIDDIYAGIINKRIEEQKYITTGLIVHYDGINNTRDGHNSTSLVWEDLSGNNNDAQFKSTTPQWESNAYAFTESNANFFETTNTVNLGAKDRTIEIVFSMENTNRQNLIGFGTIGEAKMLDLLMNTNINYHIYGNAATEGINTDIVPNKKYAAFWSYQNGIANYRVNDEIKNSVTFPILNTEISTLIIGKGIYSAYNTNNPFKIYSIRIYDRVLTNEEKEINYKIDQIRFQL